MDARRLTGPDAGALKYDLLTALSVAGLSGTPTFRTSMMRLIALVTARYNWRLDEVSVGQREMARMWAVDERTVKREMKRLVGAGILTCIRAGVRGRVGAYRLNWGRIAEVSEASWPLVGPDYAERMRARHGSASAKVVSLQRFASNLPPADETPTQPGTWERAMAHLSREDPGIYNAWFARLEFVGYAENTLRLRAPSLFIERYVETHLMASLLRAVEAEMGPVRSVAFA